MRLGRGFVFAAFATMLVISGCTRPSQYTNQGVVRFDANTTYQIHDAPGGFHILVNHNQYQFVPNRGASHDSCRRLLAAIAADHAQKLNKRMQTVDLNAIRVDSGRNIMNGRTLCTATYDVKFEG